MTRHSQAPLKLTSTPAPAASASCRRTASSRAGSLQNPPIPKFPPPKTHKLLSRAGAARFFLPFEKTCRQVWQRVRITSTPSTSHSLRVLLSVPGRCQLGSAGANLAPPVPTTPTYSASRPPTVLCPPSCGHASYTHLRPLKRSPPIHRSRLQIPALLLSFNNYCTLKTVGCHLSKF